MTIMPKDLSYSSYCTPTFCPITRLSPYQSNIAPICLFKPILFSSPYAFFLSHLLLSNFPIQLIKNNLKLIHFLSLSLSDSLGNWGGGRLGLSEGSGESLVRPSSRPKQILAIYWNNIYRLLEANLY
jgi:hypothetical protein